MLRYKSTGNLGELQKYFSSGEKMIQTLLRSWELGKKNYFCIR